MLRWRAFDPSLPISQSLTGRPTRAAALFLSSRDETSTNKMPSQPRESTPRPAHILSYRYLPWGCSPRRAALDPAIVSSERPTAVYSRAQLLALYSSPLVPNKLDGMKELQEWHGCAYPARADASQPRVVRLTSRPPRTLPILSPLHSFFRALQRGPATSITAASARLPEREILARRTRKLGAVLAAPARRRLFALCQLWSLRRRRRAQRRGRCGQYPQPPRRQGSVRHRLVWRARQGHGTSPLEPRPQRRAWGQTSLPHWARRDAEEERRRRRRRHDRVGAPTRSRRWRIVPGRT